MTSYRRRHSDLWAVAVAVFLGAGLVGCGSSAGSARTANPPAVAAQPWRTDTAALWLRSHPVPARKGMTAGLVIDSIASGNMFTSVTWTLTIARASGAPVILTCVNGWTHPACPWAGNPDVLGGAADPAVTGTYLYFRSNGELRSPADTHVIRQPS